jgi:hypothetical protein
MCRQRPLWPRPGPTANRAWRRVSDRLADVLAGRFFAASTFPDGRFYATGTAPKAAAVRTGELGVRQRVVGHVEKCGYRRAGSRRTFCSLSRHLTGRASGIALANVGLSILEMLVQAPDSRLRRAVLLGTPCPGSCRARRLTAVPRMPVLLGQSIMQWLSRTLGAPSPAVRDCGSNWRRRRPNATSPYSACAGLLSRCDGECPQACGSGIEWLSAVTALRSQR